MARMEAGLRGERKGNYIRDSDSEEREEEEVPSQVDVPVSDGLPQVSG